MLLSRLLSTAEASHVLSLICVGQDCAGDGAAESQMMTISSFEDVSALMNATHWGQAGIMSTARGKICCPCQQFSEGVKKWLDNYSRLPLNIPSPKSLKDNTVNCPDSYEVRACWPGLAGVAHCTSPSRQNSDSVANLRKGEDPNGTFAQTSRPSALNKRGAAAGTRSNRLHVAFAPLGTEDAVLDDFNDFLAARAESANKK